MNNQNDMMSLTQASKDENSEQKIVNKDSNEESKKEKEDDSNESSDNEDSKSSESIEFEYSSGLFSQELFLFLFDDELKFSSRDNFDHNKDLTHHEYQKMKIINRNMLIDKLKELKSSIDINEQIKTVLKDYDPPKLSQIDDSINDQKMYQIFI